MVGWSVLTLFIFNGTTSQCPDHDFECRFFLKGVSLPYLSRKLAISSLHTFRTKLS